MATGWNVRVTTFKSAEKPGIVRHFLAYEPDKAKAVELVCKKVPVNGGERAEAIAEIAENEFIGQQMKLGDVKQHV
jgi:hypothetical protein